MIELNESDFFGKGHHRACYRHPNDINLCVKIIIDHSLLKREAVREEKYYRHLQKRKVSWNMISRYHGEFATNIGMGAVFDLIADHDGNVSKTMEYYLSSTELSEKDLRKMADLLKQLKEYLLEQRIFARLAARNIVFQKDNLGISKVFIIDNVGNTEFIPLGNYFAVIKRKKINRQWKRFVTSTHKLFPAHIQFIEFLNEKT